MGICSRVFGVALSSFSHFDLELVPFHGGSICHDDDDMVGVFCDQLPVNQMVSIN